MRINNTRLCVHIYSYVFLCLLQFAVSGLYSQTTYQKAIGGAGSDVFMAIEKALDGGFIIAGYTKSYGSGKQDILVSKVDDKGFVLWSKAYGGDSNDYANHIFATKDNAYIVTGVTFGSGFANADAFVMKIDIAGNILWEKVYDSKYEDLALETVETNSGYMMTGSTKVFSEPMTDAMVVSIDNTGNIIWSKTYGEPDYDLFTNIIRSNDGNYILSGSYTENNIEHYNCKVAKIDKDGAVIWYNNFDGGLFEVARGLTASNDNGYVLAGATNSFSTGDFDCLVFKIDDAGKLKWVKLYKGNQNESAESITNVFNNGYMMTGFTNSYGYANRDFFAVRIDNNGKLIWSRTYGGNGWEGFPNAAINQKLRTTIPLSDNSFILATTTQSFGSGKEDIYLLKADSAWSTSDKCHSLNHIIDTSTVDLTVTTGNPNIQTLNLTTKDANFKVMNISLKDSNLCQCTVVIKSSNDTTICPRTTAKLDAGLIAAYYKWNDNSRKRQLTVGNAGTYTVTVTDLYGCIGSDTVKVMEFPDNIVKLGKDTAYCPGDSVTLDAGNKFITYLWNDNSGKQQLTVKQTGVYSVTVTDANTCVSADTVNVSEFAAIVVALGKDTSFCLGGSIALDAKNNPATYKWNNNSDKQILIANNAGVYSVTVTKASGCSGTDSINISLTKSFVINLGKDTTFCFGTTIDLDANHQAATYLWNNYSVNEILTVDKAGIYSVTVTEANGCSAADTVIVNEFPVSIVNLGKDGTICEGCEVTLDAGSGFSEYKWQDMSGNQLYIVTEPGTYYVQATDSFGCAYNDTIKFTKDCAQNELFIPNVITPNDDGVNDEFNPSHLPCILNYSMKIYNRWGILLFESNEPGKGNGWKGLDINGKAVPEGVYIYILKYKVLDEREHVKYGSVTVFR